MTFKNPYPGIEELGGMKLNSTAAFRHCRFEVGGEAISWLGDSLLVEESTFIGISLPAVILSPILFSLAIFTLPFHSSALSS